MKQEMRKKQKKVRLFILKSHNYEANLQVTEWAVRIYYKFFEEESDVIITGFQEDLFDKILQGCKTRRNDRR